MSALLDAMNGTSNATLYPFYSDCLEAAELSTSRFFVLISMLKAAILAAGTVTVTMLMWKKGTSWLLSPNSRWLFMIHNVFSILSNVLMFVAYFTDSIRLSLTFEDPCTYLLPGPLAFLLIICYVASDCIQLLLILSLSLERLGATIRPRFFEAQRTARLAYFATIICVIIGVVVTFSILVPGVPWWIPRAAFGPVTKENSKRYRIYKVCQSCVEFFSLGVFIAVRIFNRKNSHNNYAHDLRLNYQIKENRKVTSLLLPVFFFHCIVYTINQFGVTVVMAITGGFTNAVDTAIVIEFPTWACLYSLFMPLIVKTMLERAARTRQVADTIHQRNEFMSVQQLFPDGPGDNKKKF